MLNPPNLKKKKRIKKVIAELHSITLLLGFLCCTSPMPPWLNFLLLSACLWLVCPLHSRGMMSPHLLGPVNLPCCWSD